MTFTERFEHRPRDVPNTHIAIGAVPMSTSASIHRFAARSKTKSTSSLPAYQSTLARSVTFKGVGVHSGIAATLAIHSADVNTGLIFTARIGNKMQSFAAHTQNTIATEMATVVSDGSGFKISTVEHILSALSGMQIDNAVIEINGPEIPILDGSAAEFAESFLDTGIVQQTAPRKFLRILKPVVLNAGNYSAEILPFADGFRVEAEIDFAHPLIQMQHLGHTVTAKSFAGEIAPARTFGFAKDLERVQAMGFALGTSLENTVALTETGIMNESGLRFTNEFVRHKVLDAVGDLALAGLPILGNYRVKRANHTVNSLMVRALMAQTDAWEIVTLAENAEHAPLLAYAE